MSRPHFRSDRVLPGAFGISAQGPDSDSWRGLLEVPRSADTPRPRRRGPAGLRRLWNSWQGRRRLRQERHAVVREGERSPRGQYQVHQQRLLCSAGMVQEASGVHDKYPASVKREPLFENKSSPEEPRRSDRQTEPEPGPDDVESAPSTTAENELAKLQGTWEVIEDTTHGGPPIPTKSMKGVRFVFQNEALTQKWPSPDEEGDEYHVRLDVQQHPLAIDLIRMPEWAEERADDAAPLRITKRNDSRHLRHKREQVVDLFCRTGSQAPTNVVRGRATLSRLFAYLGAGKGIAVLSADGNRPASGTKPIDRA